MYSSLCCPLCDSFPQASVPFVGGNLPLSHSVHIKTVLQATSYEKTSTVSLCFPVAPCQRPSGGAHWLRQPRVTAHSYVFGEGGLVRSWGLQRFSSQDPEVQTAVRGPWDKSRRAGGEEVHFFVDGCIVTTHHLSLPRWELRGSPHIFSFSIAFIPSPISRENFTEA